MQSDTAVGNKITLFLFCIFCWVLEFLPMPHSVVVCHELDNSKLYDSLYSYFCSTHCGGTRVFPHRGLVQHH